MKKLLLILMCWIAAENMYAHNLLKTTETQITFNVTDVDGQPVSGVTMYYFTSINNLNFWVPTCTTGAEGYCSMPFPSGTYKYKLVRDSYPDKEGTIAINDNETPMSVPHKHA